MRVAVVLQAWSEVPGIVVEGDILQLLDQKCHWPKTGTQETTNTDTIVIDD